MRKLARLSGWTLAYVVVNQIGFGIALYLANGKQGGPTAYFTAFAFFQLPYGIAAVSIMTALVPTLSAQFVDRDIPGFRRGTAGAMRTTALLMLPATAVYIALARPLVQVLLERGVMRGGSTHLVASTLAMFAVGLLPFSLYVLLVRAFAARQDVRTPLVVNIVENIVTVILDFILFPHLDVRGLALAHSLGYVVGVAMAIVLLGRQTDGLDMRRTLTSFARTMVASAAALGAMPRPTRPSARVWRPAAAALLPSSSRAQRPASWCSWVPPASSGSRTSPSSRGCSPDHAVDHRLSAARIAERGAGTRRSFPFDQPGLRLTHLGRGAVWLAFHALGLGAGSRVAMPVVPLRVRGGSGPAGGDRGGLLPSCAVPRGRP